MAETVVDLALGEILGWPWRVEGLPEAVEEMGPDQLLELLDELKAERDRLDELVEEVDDLAAARDQESYPGVAALA